MAEMGIAQLMQRKTDGHAHFLTGIVRQAKQVRHRFLDAHLAGIHGGLSIVPPNPGTDGCVGLAIAGGDRYSVAFGPTSAITNKGTLSFSAKKPLAEGVCGRVPTTTTADRQL